MDEPGETPPQRIDGPAAPPTPHPTAIPGPSTPTSPPQPYWPPWTPPLPMSGPAVTSLVLGILSLWMWPLGIVLGPIAIGLGVSALRAVKRAERRGRGLAIAGISTGGAGTALGVLGVLFLAALFSGALGDGPGDESHLVASVEGVAVGRNLDADAADELAVLVTAWSAPAEDGEREYLHYEGTLVVQVYRNGGLMTGETRDVEPDDVGRGVAYDPDIEVSLPDVEPRAGDLVRVTLHLSDGRRMQDEATYGES